MGKKPARPRTPQAEQDRHAPASTPTASDAAGPRPPLAGAPPPPRTGRGWCPGASSPAAASAARLPHTLACTHSALFTPEKEPGWEGTAGVQARGRPGSPVTPLKGETPPPLVPSCSARGNTCSHFHQGMFTRRQQLYSESSRLRRRTAGPLHLRPQETPVPRAPRLCPSLPRDEEGSRNLGREGADGERRGWRGIPAPHRHAFLSHPREDGRAGGGEGGGVSPALAGTSRWRVINRCVKCRVCSGTSEPGAARIPQKGLLHPPNAGPANEPRREGLSPQQDSEG